jgi:putative ABC transport system substrate-binding protein
MRAISSYRPFKSIGVLYTESEKNSEVIVTEMKEVAKKMNFTVVAKAFKLDAEKKVTADGAAEMIKEMKDKRVDWLYLPPDSFLGTQAQKVINPRRDGETTCQTFASTEATHGGRRAHRPREPLPRDRAVHRPTRPSRSS